MVAAVHFAMQSEVFAEEKLDIARYDFSAATKEECMGRNEGSVEENVGLKAELGEQIQPRDNRLNIAMRWLIKVVRSRRKQKRVGGLGDTLRRQSSVSG